MKEDHKFKVFMHSSTSLSRIEKHVRKNANLYKSTDWREANRLLGMEYNIYILHKETKDSDTLGKLIRQRHPGALVVLVTNEPVVTQDSLDKYNADYSLAEDPTRAELLSTIPSCRKLREVQGVQDPDHIAPVIPMHVESPATVMEDGSGSAVALEQELETDDPATGELLTDPAPDEFQGPVAWSEPDASTSLGSAPAAFFAGLQRPHQSTRVTKDAGRGVLEDEGLAPAASGSRTYLIVWASLGMVILLALGIGVFAQGSHKPKKKAVVRKVTNASKPRSSAPAAASSEPSEVAPATPVAESKTFVPVSEAAGSNTITPAPALSPPPAIVNHAPSVSISGPTLVTVDQAASYHANASDPDGDSLSYSWGGSSKSIAFQNSGTFPVSVTVTDSGGLSASATIMVTVRQ